MDSNEISMWISDQSEIIFLATLPQEHEKRLLEKFSRMSKPQFHGRSIKIGKLMLESPNIYQQQYYWLSFKERSACSFIDVVPFDWSSNLFAKTLLSLTSSDTVWPSLSLAARRNRLSIAGFAWDISEINIFAFPEASASELVGGPFVEECLLLGKKRHVTRMALSIPVLPYPGQSSFPELA